MEAKDRNRQKAIAAFKLYINSRGGIFRKNRRKQLLGILGRGGRMGEGGKLEGSGKMEKQAKSTFWYKVRSSVRVGLVDVNLFVEVADRDDVNQVVTKETLEPIVKALLLKPTIYVPVIAGSEKEGGRQRAVREPPDLVRAEIAMLLIKYGFGYLKSMQMNHITSSHRRTIDDAFDLSNYLVELFKPESERRYSPPNQSEYRE
ncbi:MAG: hypothetical protein ABSG57_01905 [Candidatus Bathyarchaeia archaeon]